MNDWMPGQHTNSRVTGMNDWMPGQHTNSRVTEMNPLKPKKKQKQKRVT